MQYRTRKLYFFLVGGAEMISYQPLFETMKKKGITSYRLFKLGFPASNYYAIKRGENISTHTLDHLCRLLHCEVSDILEYIDENDAALDNAPSIKSDR